MWLFATKLFERIAKKLQEQGYGRDWKQCIARVVYMWFTFEAVHLFTRNAQAPEPP